MSTRILNASNLFRFNRSTGNSKSHNKINPAMALLLEITLLFAGIVFLSLSATPAEAQNEIYLRTGNDFLAGNSHSDDLYTGGLGLTLEFEKARINGATLRRGFVTFEENLFTDREAAVRFDETWLLLGRRYQGNDWNLSLYAGGVRAGRGVVGERVQNALHRAIGDDEVELAYVDQNHHYPVVGANLRRMIQEKKKWNLEGHTEVRIAQGFQQWATLGATWKWRALSWLELSAGAGVRASWVEYDVLEPWIEDFAPTAELGLKFKERVLLSWTNNQYGTDLGHVSLAYRLPVPEQSRRGR